MIKLEAAYCLLSSSYWKVHNPNWFNRKSLEPWKC